MIRNHTLLYLLSVALLGLFTACSQTSAKNNPFAKTPSGKVDITAVNVEEYNTYAENPDNGLVVQKEVDDVIIRAFYTPVAYLAAREAETTNTADSRFIKAYEELQASGLQYVTLQLTVAAKTDPLTYKIQNPAVVEERIKYYSFEVQKDIKLEDGGIALPCVLHHYERSYGITNNITLNLAFPKTDNSTDKVLVFDDKVYNKGVLKLKFKKENLNALLTDTK